MYEALLHPEQHLIRFRARDGFQVVGYLLMKEPESDAPKYNKPVVLIIHGLLGHFLARGTPRLLPHALLDRDLWSLSINTRLASAGQIAGKGIFDDTVHDLEAAVDFLTQEGFQRIVMLGYSLGASMVVHWAANHGHPNVEALVLEGVHYSIPDAQKRRLAKWGSSPTYEEVYERAKVVLGKDPYHSPNDETFVIYRASGPSTKPIHDELFTYKSWWHMMGPHAHAAMTHRHIEKVKVPMLLLRGEHDPLVEQWEPEALAQLARAAGNQEVRVRQIQGAAHDCMENFEEMLEQICTLA